jgi:hypothetical protein
MEDNDLIVGRQPNVALYAGTRLEGCSESAEAVFGKAGARVQAPVRETRRSGVERIRV